MDLTLFYLNVELTLIKALKFLNANKRAINRGNTLLFDMPAFLLSSKVHQCPNLVITII